MFLDDYKWGASLAADLVNTVGSISGRDYIGDRASLREFLEERGVPGAGSVTAKDLAAIKDLRDALTRVFHAPTPAGRVRLLNELLRSAPIVPQLREEEDGPHLYLDAPERALAERVAALTAAGLAGIISELGPDRTGFCEASDCDDVYADTSKNGSRRFCSESCASRTHVAVHRARRAAQT